MTRESGVTLRKRNKTTINKEINENNFSIIKLIGKGKCSKVYLCKCIIDNKFYAVKMMSKIDIIRKDMID